MIHVKEVRLIGTDGKQLGIVPTEDALRMAEDAGLDLVEIAPTARPPVCKIMDYGKYMYELSRKAKLARKKQHIIHVKEMRFSPKISEHDFSYKIKQVIKFLEKGDRVKITMFFRGRQKTHLELGEAVIEKILDETKEYATVEKCSKFSGSENSPTLVKPIRLEGKSFQFVLMPRGKK
ncbi:MAG: translation initiation factor IF-3 [candidate division Zixibacteria bacterium 4484_93]|nr:translation initiation factor IF-3 [Armatimonadota bacterium]OQX89202.1 MAG: translation initiation factor IF-3 [candidate division Zixibacteria bacterium 4484_93]